MITDSMLEEHGFTKSTIFENEWLAIEFEGVKLEELGRSPRKFWASIGHQRRTLTTEADLKSFVHLMHLIAEYK